MTNLKFKQTLTAGFVLSLALYPQAWAHSWATKTCNDPNGYACYNCGSDCTATLYQDGKLVVSGTGTVKGGDEYNVTFSNSAVKPTSLIIKEGITSIGTNAFWAIGTVTSLDLPDSLTSVGPDGLSIRGTGVTRFIVGEKSFSNASNIPLAQNVTVVCRGDINLCRTGKGGMFNASGIRFTNELRDENGKLLEEWNENEHLVYDENGNIIARYTKSGDLFASYIYNDDKSVEIYDGNGKLTGLKNAKSITPAQAAALIKKCNCNSVKLTFK